MTRKTRHQEREEASAAMLASQKWLPEDYQLPGSPATPNAASSPSPENGCEKSPAPFDARNQRFAALGRRAWAIVNRVRPPLDRAPHGWYDRQGFILACQYNSKRNQLYRSVFFRLVDKANAADLALTEVEGDPMLKARAAA